MLAGRLRGTNDYLSCDEDDDDDAVPMVSVSRLMMMMPFPRYPFHG